MSETRAPYGPPAPAPEAPDFKTIALRVVTDLEAITGTAPSGSIAEVNAQTRQLRAVVVEQLRLVWNARGAADIAKLESVLPNLTTVKLGAMKELDRALNTLDVKG